MEASDTVMSDKQIQELSGRCMLPCTDYDRQVAGIQAEITWKAREPEIQEARKAGIKEAGLQLRARMSGIDEFVDWSDEGVRQFRKMTLQAIKDLLKEWGVGS